MFTVKVTILDVAYMACGQAYMTRKVIKRISQDTLESAEYLADLLYDDYVEAYPELEIEIIKEK